MPYVLASLEPLLPPSPPGLETPWSASPSNTGSIVRFTIDQGPSGAAVQNRKTQPNDTIASPLREMEPLKTAEQKSGVWGTVANRIGCRISAQVASATPARSSLPAWQRRIASGTVQSGSQFWQHPPSAPGLHFHFHHPPGARSPHPCERHLATSTMSLQQYLNTNAPIAAMQTHRDRQLPDQISGTLALSGVGIKGVRKGAPVFPGALPQR
jgi:hypothetical protein